MRIGDGYLTSFVKKPFRHDSLFSRVHKKLPIPGVIIIVHGAKDHGNFLHFYSHKFSITHCHSINNSYNHNNFTEHSSKCKLKTFHSFAFTPINRSFRRRTATRASLLAHKPFWLLASFNKNVT